jgi:hypothetical protein
MRRLAPLAITVLLPACSAGAFQGGSGSATKPYVTKGPVITGVTQHEAWVAWETAETRGRGCGDGAPRLVLDIPGKAPASFEDPHCGKVHHVHLEGLAPATAYTFTLDHGAAHGGPVEGRFSTATADPEASFRFVVYGDNRDAPVPMASTRPAHTAIAEAILAHERDAAFLLHTGDLALNLPLQHGYQEFFDVERALLASRPIFPTVGNHEKLELDEFDGLVNAASFARAPHPYYSAADWGAVHFVTLDTFEDHGIGPAQLAWLEADLAAAEQAGKLVFAVTHQGPYSHCVKGGSCHGGLPKDRGHDALVKTLTAHHVAAIFSGHDHYYQRGREGEGCLQYLVVGGGGAPMYDPAQPGPDAPGVLFAKKLTSYVTVTVKGHAATFEAKGTDGSVIDSGVLAPAATGPCPP